tara:strand:- start:743 stop:1000 length:258 start_codon:yes stop_codon:yes gene_type:complete
MSNRHNLNKLKELCQELTDRDRQLKINASALWQILEVTEGVTSKLESIDADGKNIAAELKSCIGDLKEIGVIITEKGCKKVQNDH